MVDRDLQSALLVLLEASERFQEGLVPLLHEGVLTGGRQGRVRGGKREEILG
jgi:hypothetical protein